ncbi:MAG TPA: hypothetical protein VGG27_13835 [Magnetospirillaceae bacterium]
MARAVFLHSGFRSGSTWFWSRFRACADAYAYCEPFNVRLAALTPGEVINNHPDAWASGHPKLTQPYFAEYAPLLKREGGIVDFDPRFAVESYFQIEADPTTERYIATLKDLARRNSKTPVLGFCGTLGRVDWFKRFADGINVITWRNPRDQWCSTHNQLVDEGNIHFEVHYLLVAYVGRLNSQFAPLLEGLPPIPSPDSISADMPLFARPEGAADRFRVFLRVFLIDTLLSVQAADTVVDLDLLSVFATYRREAKDQLREQTGLKSLSFDDCRLPNHRFRADADYASLLSEGLAWLDGLAGSPWAKTFETSLPFARGRLADLIASEAAGA